MEEFKIIVLTWPEDVSDESLKITELLDSGAADIVHIRKPDMSVEETRCLIRSIPSRLHNRLRLHNCFTLCSEFNLGGVHLNSRNPECHTDIARRSVSCHTPEEVAKATGYDYITLSPIFNSISKPGYHASAGLIGALSSVGSIPVIALGGVTPERFGLLADAGFAGAALLGYVWQDNSDESGFENKIKTIINAATKARCGINK